MRLVSLTQRAIAAISYRVTPVDEPLRLVVMSEIVANEEIPVTSADPRAAAILAEPLVSEEHNAVDGEHPRAILVHGTRSSKLRLAAGMAHEVTGPDAHGHPRRSRSPTSGGSWSPPRCPPGEELRLVKYLGYGWSASGHGPRSSTR